MSEQNLNHNPGKCRIFTWNKPPNIVTPTLFSSYEAGEFCDITLIAGIGNSEVKAHRMVLSASSEYFKAMFRSNLKDATAKEVKLEQWDGETLKMIVDFMYTKTIQLGDETVENIVRAADFFQLIALVEACCSFMIEQLDSCNCLRLIFLAELYNYTQLYEKSLNYACIHFEEVSTEQEFLELNHEQLSRLISRDDLSVLSERSVLRSVVSWIKHDQVNREPFILGLLQHIRYPLLDAKYVLENRQYLCSNFECQKLVLDWLHYLILPESRELYPQAITKPRKTFKKLFFLSGWDSNVSLKVQMYNPETNEWIVVSWPHPMRNKRLFAPPVDETKLYTAGSDMCVHTSTEFECPDSETMKWSMFPSMRLPRRWFSMAELDGNVYGIGDIRSSCLRTVVKYNPRVRTWAEVCPVPAQLTYVQVVVIGQLLYVVCGRSGNMMCYDPIRLNWSTLPMRNERSAQFGLGSLGGHLYTLGGHFNHERSKTVERYDPLTDEWTQVSSLSVARSRILVTTLGNRLIACGGHDGKRFLKIVEEYDPAIDQWTTLMSDVPYQ